MPIIASEVKPAPERTISTAWLSLVKLNSYKISESQFLDMTNVFDLSPGSIFELASLTYLKGVCDAFEIIGIAKLGLACSRVDLRIFSQEILFPFSEILIQGIIGFLRNGIFFNLVSVFDFFVNGCRIEISDMNNHSIFDSIKVECSHVFFHLSNEVAFFVFEGQPDIIRFGSISFLNVLFKSEYGGIGINSEFRDFER